MGKRQNTIFVDSARTRTADDVVEMGECQALIRRHARDISDVIAKGADKEGAPSHLRTTLHYKNLALSSLKRRRSELSKVEV